MTGPELAVAAEIVRLAGGLLELSGPPPSLDEPLAGRLDSLQLLTLVVAIEDRFRIVLTDDDAAGAETLEAVARLVVQRASPASLPGGQPAAER